MRVSLSLLLFGSTQYPPLISTAHSYHPTPMNSSYITLKSVAYFVDKHQQEVTAKTTRPAASQKGIPFSKMVTVSRTEKQMTSCFFYRKGDDDERMGKRWSGVVQREQRGREREGERERERERGINRRRAGSLCTAMTYADGDISLNYITSPSPPPPPPLLGGQ